MGFNVLSLNSLEVRPLSLVDYQCAAYLKQLPFWRLLEDVYEGDSAWIDYKPDGKAEPTAKARRYLPQESTESDSEYRDRLLRSHFSDRFAQAVRDFVGVIFNNGVRLVDVPDQILEHWGLLDSYARDGSRFCAELALRSLRLGHTFCLIDFPEFDQTVQTMADAIAAGRRPFWEGVSPLQVINWRFKRVGGRQVLSWAVICYEQFEPDGMSPWGEKKQTYYKVLTPGRYDTYVIAKGADGKPQQVRLPGKSGVMGLRRRGGLVAFDQIPLVCFYGGDRIGFFQSNPSLLSLARLNVSHYQVKSDHRLKMHYCSFPTPFRVGGDGSDLGLGPRTVVDVPIGGAFGWTEPNSQSLVQSRQEVLDIEAEMDFLGADYLIKPSDRQAAMTSVIQAAKVESELYLFASDFAQGMTDALSWHARWLGLPSGGRAELNTKFFQELSSDPQLLMALLQARERDDITRSELREIANRKYQLQLS